MSKKHLIFYLMLAFVMLTGFGIFVATQYRIPAELDCSVCTEDTVFQDAWLHGTGVTAPVVTVLVYVTFG